MNEIDMLCFFKVETEETGTCTRPYWRSGISSTRERNSASFHSFRYAPLVKRRNFSHSWKKSQIFIRDSCKNLLVFLAFVGQVLFALLLHTCGPENYFTLLWCFIWIVNKKTCIYTPANKVWGVYRNHPVRPSMYLVSATSPKPLIGFLWNFIHL